MSVTIEDILRLPCLREARVLAGKGGLQRTVSSVTVLEYSTANELQERIFSSLAFYGSEIVISAFANAVDSVDIQCTNIRMLAEAGEVGLILYYVGIILPAVDPRLIELADSLDFVLISMPENRYDLRYSEVIFEVMESIVKDQLTDTRFQNEILDRVSRLPGYQRSIDTVMRMLSDRLHCSLVLTDESCQPLNVVAWPRAFEAELQGFFGAGCPAPQDEIFLGGAGFCLQESMLKTSQGMALRLFFCREGEGLTEDDMRQASEVMQIAINLWSSGYGQEILPELVRAILQDEPVRMRRIAAAFHIDVASIHNMWVLQPRSTGEEGILPDELAQGFLQKLRESLSHICSTVVADSYEGRIVAFMDDPRTKEGLIVGAQELVSALSSSGVAVTLSAFFNLRNTKAVRRAYLLACDAISTARIVFPHVDVFSGQQLNFAQDCRASFAQGEDLVKERLRVLEPVTGEDRLQFTELCDTLAVYMLDAAYNSARAADLLFLHKNTIKYRIARIEERIGYPVDRMPESIPLYEALALRRVLLAESGGEEGAR